MTFLSSNETIHDLKKKRKTEPMAEKMFNSRLVLEEEKKSLTKTSVLELR